MGLWGLKYLAWAQGRRNDEHYGKAMTDTKRQAHSKVVEMVFKSSKTENPKKPVAGSGSLWGAQKST